jgi:hypothetical protein
MADYDPVTVDQFTTRFPIFALRPQPQIAAVLAEASGRIDNRWRAQDFPIAIMYLTAHLLALDASQATDDPAIGPSGAGQVIQSESIAGMSVSYFNGLRTSSGAGGTPSDLTQTEYGRRYLKLLRANFAGPVVV